jgi:hypothetical protein
MHADLIFGRVGPLFRDIVMIRDLYGVRVVFVRFHDASHVVVEVNGKELVLKKSVWASLPGSHDVSVVEPSRGDGAKRAL